MDEREKQGTTGLPLQGPFTETDQVVDTNREEPPPLFDPEGAAGDEDAGLVDYEQAEKDRLGDLMSPFVQNKDDETWSEGIADEENEEDDTSMEGVYPETQPLHLEADSVSLEIGGEDSLDMALRPDEIQYGDA